MAHDGTTEFSCELDERGIAIQQIIRKCNLQSNSCWCFKDAINLYDKNVSVSGHIGVNIINNSM